MRIFQPIIRSMRAIASLGVVAVALVWFTSPARGEELHTSNPHMVIAGYLHAFPAYVQWPTNSTTTNNSVTNPPPWRIGILGDDPFDESLIEAVKNRPVAGRDFEIVRSSRAEELFSCDMIYIATKDEKKISTALNAIAARPVLTVGEEDDFLQLGGIINMDIGHTVKLDINLDHARAAGLKISAGMLEVAAKVIENGRLKEELK